LSAADEEGQQKIVDFLVPSLKKWWIEDEGLQGDVVAVEGVLEL
jgi:hypothetical protein